MHIDTQGVHDKHSTPLGINEHTGMYMGIYSKMRLKRNLKDYHPLRDNIQTMQKHTQCTIFGGKYATTQWYTSTP